MQRCHGAPHAIVVGGTHTKMPPTLAEVMKKKSPSDWMFPATIESGSGPCQRGHDGQLKAGGCTPCAALEWVLIRERCAIRVVRRTHSQRWLG